MALSKVPDSALDQLRCGCGRYLSTAPIMVCQNGQSVCNKCVNLQTPLLGTVTENLAYEALAKLFKFPCCYKPQGCSQYVDFNKAAEHEGECLYRVYECPVNLLSSCNKRGTTTELCEHYEQNHPEWYLQYPSSTVDVTTDFEWHRLFKADDAVFLLQTKSSTSVGKLWFNTIYFGNAVDASLISYNIKLSSADDKKRVMELEQEKPCSINNILMLPSQYVEVDISIAVGFLNQSELQCHWVINIPEEIKDKIKNQQKLKQEEFFKIRKKNIRCPICDIYMVSPIYRCEQNHVTCVDCKGYDNQCRNCFKIDIKFKRAADLEMISKSGNHHCKWKNCNQEFPSDMIRSHEQECFYRVYKCPECIWSGIYDMFLNHFKSAHSHLSIHRTNAVALSLHSYSSYIIVERELFKFAVNRHFLQFDRKDFAFDVTVYFLGYPSYASYWKYEIKDDFGNVYNFWGEQYTIKRLNEGQTTWAFRNIHVEDTKCYGLYITKNN